MVAVLAQISTSFLDLLGVALIGIVAALAVSTAQGTGTPPFVDTITSALPMLPTDPVSLTLWLGLFAAIALTLKTTLSYFLTRKLLGLLAGQQADVSERLTQALLSRPLLRVTTGSSQETSYALVYGVLSATSGLLGNAAIAASEISLLAVLGIGLMIVSPALTLGALLFFGVLALILNRALAWRIGKESAQRASAQIESLRVIKEAIDSYREISVTNRRSLFIDRISALRREESYLVASTQMLSQTPKYLFEAALVVGGASLAVALLATSDAVAAVGTLALFIAAASRVVPSLLRLQAAALGIRIAEGLAGPVYEMQATLEDAHGSAIDAITESALVAAIDSGHQGFSPTIDIRHASITYPGAERPALDRVSLSATAGSSLALVGLSGAGKSTLADVLLGLVVPDSGDVLLGGVTASEALARWPGAIAYVPQSVAIVSGTIRDNVALGFSPEFVSEELVWEAIEKAQLGDLLREERQGLDTVVGEGGTLLSGGQRQRLGLARALYSRPRLLVLDEATSALDSETELAITRALSLLAGEVTTVTVAHRLATVRESNLVVYLKEGRIAALGSFDEVRRQVPEFEYQASLMGL